jgi:hypothetical protein
MSAYFLVRTHRLPSSTARTVLDSLPLSLEKSLRAKSLANSVSTRLGYSYVFYSLQPCSLKPSDFADSLVTDIVTDWASDPFAQPMPRLIPFEFVSSDDDDATPWLRHTSVADGSPGLVSCSDTSNSPMPDLVSASDADTSDDEALSAPPFVLQSGDTMEESDAAL